MSSFYYPTFKCRFCEKEFDDGDPYCSTDDAVSNLAGMMRFHPVHYCDNGHIGIGDFTGFERVDKND